MFILVISLVLLQLFSGFSLLGTLILRGGFALQSCVYACTAGRTESVGAVDMRIGLRFIPFHISAFFPLEAVVAG